ncbi:MAG TPA: DUF5989 family protein [Candidatus Binatia bacterium]|jgi:hypothetical protein|nr:DUF5989 family protein [Candidatus Binatia bacterium]
MSWKTRMSDRIGIFAEFVAFLWERKLWWMIPMVVVLVLCGALLILAQTSAIAPFIYPLF